MPDLTIVIMQECSNNTGNFMVGKHHVLLRDNGFHECDCHDFRFRRKRTGEPCKHIEEALEKQACGWHQQWSDESQTDEQRANHICPRCGCKTISVRVGV